MALPLLQFLAASTVTLGPPATVARIDPRHRLVEGVATDGRTIWASSVLDRTIVTCRRTCRDLAVLPVGFYPLGIAWDRDRQRLWVAAECPELPGIAKCDRGALLALDRTGRIRAHFAPNGSFHVGDVSAAAGQVFVSDSRDGAVYRLVGRSVVPLLRTGVGKSAQGSAVDASGKRLIVADYSQGIAVMDLASGGRTILRRDDGRPVRGIDGLLRCGTNYYGIYNGVPPGRLIRFTVDGDRIAFETLIEGGVLSDPTQLATDGKRLLIVANAGWEPAAKGKARTELAPILSVPLPQPCS